MTRTEGAQFLLRGRALIALIVLVVFFTLVESAFLTGANIETLIKQTALNTILSIGMTFVILTGGIDLSVGSIVGLTGIIAGLLINQGLEIGALGIVIYPHTWMVLLIALAAATLMGAINGFIITRFNVAPFIATLGMLLVARGLAGLLNGGKTFPNLIGKEELGNTGFRELGTGKLADLVPWAIVLMVIFAVVAWFITTRTPFGRAVYAVGGNERSAELSGVRVARTKMLVYMISALCAGDGRPHHRLAAGGGPPGHGPVLRALRHRRGRVRRHVAVRRSRHDRGHGHRRLRHRHAADRPHADGHLLVLELIITGTVIVLALIIDQLQQRADRRLALQQQAAQIGPASDSTTSTSRDS